MHRFLIIALYCLLFIGSPPSARAQVQECPEGHNQCQPKLDSYWACVDKACNNKPGSYQGCPKGKAECLNISNSYWDCVGKECQRVAGASGTEDSRGASTASTPGGGPTTSAFPVPSDDRVTMKNTQLSGWAARLTPDRRLMLDSPMNYLRCTNVSQANKPVGFQANIPLDGITLRCLSNDVCSCHCITFDSSADNSPYTPNPVPISTRSGRRTTEEFGCCVRDAQGNSADLRVPASTCM